MYTPLVRRDRRTFPIYIRAQQGTLATVSQLWIPMLLLEVPLISLPVSIVRPTTPFIYISSGVLNSARPTAIPSWPFRGDAT